MLERESYMCCSIIDVHYLVERISKTELAFIWSP